MKCRDESYYTGITKDMERRMDEHNSGESPDSCTAIRRPVKLVFVETFNDFAIAEQWEKRWKGWSGRKKKTLIQNNWDKLKEYFVVKIIHITRILKKVKNN